MLHILTDNILKPRQSKLTHFLYPILIVSRAEIVRWVCENARPFNIVSDRGFRSLMKTGRPEYYIPSPSTVSRDVKQVFVHTRNRIAKMLKETEAKLSFATDAWTSPNHKAYVAVTVHFEQKGQPMCLILDVVEVAKVNTTVTVKPCIRHSPILKVALRR
jgi:hypothetical protein